LGLLGKGRPLPAQFGFELAMGDVHVVNLRFEGGLIIFSDLASL
jgi:hypothetical protein